MNGMLLKTKSNEVDGRIVTVAVNAFGNVDSQNDISVKGSFTKTLNENFKRIKHFLNHDYSKLIGCPLEGKEEGGHLVMRSELANTQLANDVLEFYKLYQKNGLTLEHSIGVEAMQRDKADTRKVLQWKMWEFSTLYNWGANSDTPLIDIKQMMGRDLPEKCMAFVKDALELDFSDHILVKYDDLRKLLEKASEGKAGIVSCDCGHQFDYFAQDEHSFDRELIETYTDTLRWMFDTEARSEAHKLEPQVREEAMEILQGLKGKSISEGLAYVTCPYCGRRHYRNEIINEVNSIQPVAEPSREDTTQGQPSGLTFAALGNIIR